MHIKKYYKDILVGHSSVILNPFSLLFFRSSQKHKKSPVRSADRIYFERKQNLHLPGEQIQYYEW